MQVKKGRLAGVSLAACVIFAAAVLTSAGGNAFAQTSPGDSSTGSGDGPPIFSNAARIHPVRARNGMVVAQEARAAAIGRDFMRRGGNA
ncbi:MAG: hypothetical protein KDJ29_18135, partial [Hyphomicrobiales bacterium]|nr:hypothetical protein [Hyphomicrobiales bacterium]